MTIKEFENVIKSKYKVEIVKTFEGLRQYLTHEESYPTFTPFEVSEGVMDDNDFYAAYGFFCGWRSRAAEARSYSAVRSVRKSQ